MDKEKRKTEYCQKLMFIPLDSDEWREIKAILDKHIPDCPTEYDPHTFALESRV